MSDVVISPNMNLPVPIVSIDPGPDWANNLNSCLGILDQHDHTSGRGVPITPSGLNINTDLPINGNNITLVKTINFSSQSMSIPGTSPNLGCVYVAGNELYYNDENGNVVQITNSGSVNSGAGSITGLPSGTASASYSGGSSTFIWQSATSTPANMDMASIIIRNLVANSFGLTISPPNALGADYSIVMPLLPGANSFVALDASGNETASIPTSLGITGANIAPNTITEDKIVNGFGLVPTGAFLPFGGTSAPSGYLLCDGASVLRASYPDLFSAIGTAYGTADGTHFNVPDLRGQFIRGVDNGAGRDPDASIRTAMNTGGNTGDNVGSVQSDSFESHIHAIKYDNSNPGAPTQAFSNASIVTTSNAVGLSGPILPTGQTETRPINAYANYIIKT